MTNQLPVESVMSQVGGAMGNYSQLEKITVNIPPVVDGVTIDILLTATLELFKFQTCKQRRLCCEIA